MEILQEVLENGIHGLLNKLPKKATPSQRLIMIIMAFNIWEDGLCWLSTRKIQDLSNLTEPTVTTAIQQLEEFGVISTKIVEDEKSGRLLRAIKLLPNNLEGV